MIKDSIYRCEHCGQRFNTVSCCERHELECSKMSDAVRHTLVVPSLLSEDIRFEKGEVHRRYTAESEVYFNTFMGEVVCYAWMPADRPDNECRLRLLEASMKVFGALEDRLAAKMSELGNGRKTTAKRKDKRKEKSK